MEGDSLNFCLECGTLLQCPLCDYCGFSNKHFSNRPIITRKKLPPSKRLLQLTKKRGEKNDQPGRATIEGLCEKCGNDQLTFYTKQMRSADEGLTTFYECLKCGWGYSENA